MSPNFLQKSEFVTFLQSCFSLSSDGRKLDNRICDPVDGLSLTSVYRLTSAFEQIQLRQLRHFLCDCSYLLLICLLFLFRSIHPMMSDSVDLKKRRRVILDLSISKIQTMNASNVTVSLRKSLLIHNMIKSLQVYLYIRFYSFF